jgi:predicted DNA-binding protein YlxM (UPF0122 family)
MPDREPEDEWKESSDWNDIVGWDGGYILGVGYCYVKQFDQFFKKKKKYYHFFQTKWGRCDTTLLFSALRPDSIIVPVAWGNATTLCKSTDTLFRIWNSILNNLISLNVKTMVIDFPAAWHISNLAIENKGINNVQNMIDEKRQLYKDMVINQYLSSKNIEYIDLYYNIDYSSKYISENHEQQKTGSFESPWHMTQELIDIVGENFLKFANNNYDKNIFLSEIKQCQL